jgi:F-type H+-transporting ATPase subunit b
VKGVLPWVLIFISAFIFTFFVDLGGNFFGLSDMAVQVMFAANLTLFLWLLARFAGRPIVGALGTRQQDITNELETAKKRVQEAHELRQEVQQRLDQVETEVAELRERAAREGQAEAAEIEQQTAADEQRFLKRIDEEITRREAEAKDNLAKETATLTAQLTKELLKKELSDADRQRILDRSLSAMTESERE